MGTRGLIGTIHDGVLHGSYSHYDNYPTGTGRILQDEIQTLIQGHGVPVDKVFDELRPMVARMRYVDAGDTPTAEDLEAFSATHDKSVSAGNDWYAVLRGNHNSLLKPLRMGVATEDTEFLKDSLFCEWAYIFDFDETRVLVLEGFNKNPDEEWERCKVDVAAWRPRYDGEKLEYYGCRLAWQGTLQEFLDLDMQALEEDLSSERNEREALAG